LGPWLELVASTALIVKAPPLSEQVCSDADDDMFLACALASRSKFIVTGDKALLVTSGFEGITVLTPRQFMERHLK
jgi:predicted nucleic acid-binding protein